jgi:hypothetical protein
MRDLFPGGRWVLTVVNTTGNYVGNGDPDDSATCPEPSGDTSAGGKQGTLCTFFKYVAGGLQAANKFVSLPLNIKRSLSDVDSDGGQERGQTAVVDLACADELEARRSPT